MDCDMCTAYKVYIESEADSDVYNAIDNEEELKVSHFISFIQLPVFYKNKSWKANYFCRAQLPD